MGMDIIDLILSVTFVVIVLAVIAWRRAGMGLVATAKPVSGKWSRLLENIAKSVVVAFGITFIVAVVVLLYRRG